MDPTYKVDIPRIVRWLFRSQTTYEVHPHLIRFNVGMPEDPRSHSRLPPALLDAAPAAAADSVNTTADPFTSCVIEAVLEAPPIEPGRHLLLPRPPSITSTASADLSKDAMPDADTTAAVRDAGTAAVQALLDSTQACTDAAVGEAAFDAPAHAAPDAEGAAAEVPRRSVAWAADVMRRAGASAAPTTGALRRLILHMIPDIYLCVFCGGGTSGVRGPRKAPAYAPCCPVSALLPCWCAARCMCMLLYVMHSMHACRVACGTTAALRHACRRCATPPHRPVSAHPLSFSAVRCV